MTSRAERSADWQQPGPDVCESCGVAFHAEIGYYCGQCDACLCPVCLTTSQVVALALCPGCAREEETP